MYILTHIHIIYMQYNLYIHIINKFVDSGSKACGTGSVAVCDPTERRTNGLAALKAMCESTTLSSHMAQLLSAK